MAGAIQDKLRHDSDAIEGASNDYGNIVHEIPYGVLYPSSVDEIIDLIKSSNDPRSIPFTIAATGHGHSVRGQAMARDGVVVEMSSLNGTYKNESGNIVSWDNSSSRYYADVGGGMLWIDVLNATLDHGFAPISWTDYLYLTVGGTLSNAGISGQTFKHGPQINNVLELDVVTGIGDLITCTRDENYELFFAVLGGLGQFGILTRARIVLDKAPTRVKWVRLLYTNFSEFTTDQEYLISRDDDDPSPDYVEGFLITNKNTTERWRSSFWSSSSQSDIVSLLETHGLLYSIELVKYYDDETVDTIDEDFGELMNGLKYEIIFSKDDDVSFLDFINRVGDLGNQNGPEQSHPWLNLFIPKSQIADFNYVVLATMMPELHDASGLFIFYPLNRNKWDDQMSVVIPDKIPEEDVFYSLALLHSCHRDESQFYDNFNNRFLALCENNGIDVKQYLPNHKSQEEWRKHYGPKWETIQGRKEMFDPKMILSPGQRIFNHD